MSYKLGKAQSTLKSYFPNKNFMTPNIIEYGQIDGFRAYELSSGTGFSDEPLYGVTIARKLNGRKAEPLYDQSKPFSSEAEARAYIQRLKDGKAE